MVIHNDDGFTMANCYDFRYNDNKYNKTGCYEEGQHCWDNQCHNGTLCICDDDKMCNNPEGPTSSPRPTTAGSGLTCQYGLVPGNGSSHNLTTQICNKNETMCITVYNLHNRHGPVSEGFTWFSCHDPSTQDGAFNQTDACFDDAIFCTPPHHEGDQPDCQDNATVCTCNTDLCNMYNMTSSNSPAKSTTTQVDTMRCWFGEKHPSTGNETWKVEVCEENENHCYQLVSLTGYETRECWDLKYEDEQFAGDGCYKGKYCHHEHCFEDATVCICDSPECNDWSKSGNVTTPVPVTPGSGILCYEGEWPDIESTECFHHQSMCGYLLTDGGKERGTCYDPQSNNGQFYTPGCFSDVDVQNGDHKDHGRFCICDGDEEDLCNGDFFKHDPNNASQLAHGLLSLLLIFVPFYFYIQ